MEKKWWQRFKVLGSPLALGIYLTFTFVWLSFSYYTSKDQGTQSSLLVQIIRRAHEISIDYRLLARGPKKPHANVALLTVDAQAVETLGRWPWPRTLIAQSIQRAVDGGAKVLGFDIVFAEAQRNELLSSAADLYEKGIISEDQKSKLIEMANISDADTKLAQTMEKNRRHLVGGTFYQFSEDQNLPPGEVDYCMDLVFRTTPEFELWDQEEILVSVQDPLQATPPFAMSEIFAQIIRAKKDAIRNQYLESNPGADEHSIKNFTHLEMIRNCSHFLDDAEEIFNPIWESHVLSQMNPAEFSYPTYRDWLNEFRRKSPPNGVPIVEGWDMNIPKLQNAMAHNSYFNAHQDSDGTIRSSSLISRTGLFYFPSLALKSYLVGMDRNAAITLGFNPATGRKEITKFEITDNNTGEVVESIPTDGQGRLQINYYGPQKMFPHLSFAELLSDSDTLKVQQRLFNPKTQEWEEKDVKVNRKEFLKDKYLLLGATATGIFDLRVTPFEKKTYPGLETHANALANMLEKNYLKPWEDERSQMIVFLLVLGIFHTLVLTQMGALGGMIMTVVLLSGVVGLDKFVLFDNGFVVTVVWPVLLLLTIYLCLTTYRYLTEERGKKELRQTFQKYVSPSIVEEILSDPKNIELGGKKMDLTVFFSDVRGFTTISEKLDPHALSELLNEYLTPMTEIVFKNQGTLDKYMGDAVMAFFGAPIPIEKHAHFACRAALESLDKLFELQKEFEARGLPLIDIGIGLNSGEVSAGNMGSKTVRSYTVMGDAVNLASRLEGINKQYGTRIVISEFTHSRVKEVFACREIDWVRVKGKTKPVKIYELIKEGALAKEDQTHLDTYNQAYSLYRSQNFVDAQELFSKALDMKPDDQVSQMFLSRCSNYISEPPGEDWDGVFEMKTK
ncbi:MAG TPA: hypothetical protein DCL41_08975 [Bdellovibrionales bacterium]|nr:hypothetical protein [Pseudobdellovibrionaceae bacterium]HAG91992.1 hypothetical protein [Bdellovibrionales bacterium]|tara:strand:- start:1232 stop:3934 length:2703 start_codon:yes stop_codon:yes gene_type:complete